MSDAWMPLYIGDYKADTAHLSTIEDGAYLLLIFHYWRAGCLPKDDGSLARIAKMTAKQWASHKSVILAFFDADLKHKRIDIERQKAIGISEKRRAVGALGGKAKSLKNNNEVLAKAKFLLEQKARQSQSQSQLDTNVSDNNNNQPKPIDILCEVLSVTTALDLLTHRLAKKSKLTPRAAKELVKAFKAYGNPEEAAAEMMLRGWIGFKPEWMENQQRAGPSSNGKGGMASLLAKSMGLKNGRESSNTTQAVHVLPIDNGAKRGNERDDGGQLSGNIIDLQPRYIG